MLYTPNETAGGRGSDDLSAELMVQGSCSSDRRIQLNSQLTFQIKIPRCRVFADERYRAACNNPLGNDRKKHSSLFSNVKVFTRFGESLYSQKRSYRFCRLSQRNCIPRRTIRRVHVMPWATPIRRIGITRVEYRGPESDAPNGRDRRRN